MQNKLFLLFIFILLIPFNIFFINNSYAECNNLCCKNILCIIVKDAISINNSTQIGTGCGTVTNFEILVNIQHGRNCPTLISTVPNKIRYVVNPNYSNILQDLVKCEICGGTEVDLGDRTCQAYCCIKEGYILDKKYKILHSLSCELLAKHYDVNWCVFKKKTYRLFTFKEIEFVNVCDKCLYHEKRLQ